MLDQGRQIIMDVRNICLLALCVLSASAQEDWELHCNRCHCLWVSGKKTANCAGRGFDSIPDDLSVDIREIDFSNNFFYSLQREVFSKAYMADVQKLKLQNCRIGKVNEFAFSKLKFIIELNLAMNYIDTLDKNVFKDTIKLRTLLLSNNKIRVLEDGLFNNLTFLQKILLDYNEIEHISEKTFRILPALTHISLAHNKIQRITFDITVGLPKLTSLNVEGNPWICDCLLREFRNSAEKNNLITTSITCQNPPRLKGRSWLDNIVFACKPEVVEAGPFATMEALNSNSNISLTCKVIGDPIPAVDWMTSGAIIERDPRRNKQKYITSKDTIDGVTWNNLTIINVGYKDRGDYKCMAKNPGGEDSRNVTVVVHIGAFAGAGFVGGIGCTYSCNTYLIIGLSIGYLIVPLIVLIILFFFFKRNSYINPVMTTVPPSGSRGRSTVVESEHIHPCDDEPLRRKSNMMLDTSDFPLNSHYPPDHLHFPPRMAQVSPADSSASTVADTTRLRPYYGPQPPMPSPRSDHSLYLPNPRSLSPFVRPVTT